jgi:hypothetical protein
LVSVFEIFQNQRTIDLSSFEINEPHVLVILKALKNWWYSQKI